MYGESVALAEVPLGPNRERGTKDCETSVLISHDRACELYCTELRM